jgi:UDP-glucose 4-epimerase
MKSYPKEYSFLHNKTILITGGAGYIATNLLELIKNTKCSIIRVDRAGAVFPPILGNFCIQDVVSDIRDPTIWKGFIGKVDIIFHFAAQTSVYKSAQDPVSDLNVNVLPMVNLINAFKFSNRLPFIVFSSTVTIAGLVNSLPVDETFNDRPITLYDLHKQMAENYLKYFIQAGLVSGCILRLANVYGPGPRSSSADRGVLNSMIRKAIDGETLTIYGEGNYIRDYIYIEDVAKAFVAAAAHKDRVNGVHAIIGSGTGSSFKDAVHLVAERVALKIGKTVKVTHVDPPQSLSAIETRNFVANTRLFIEATGWKPEISFIEGIDKTIDEVLQEKVGTH